MARIVTVYSGRRESLKLIDMSFIRWLRISAALARQGHEVDIATNEKRWFVTKSPALLADNLRKIPLRKVQWQEYDVVKTLFHSGFETLQNYGGERHPFIISKLGSVVGPEDMPGIYFYGGLREKLFKTQQKIAASCRHVTVLSKPAKDLWAANFGGKKKLFLVPGGVDRDIPPPGKDPFPKSDRARCIFAGNIYTKNVQPEANKVLCEKLNELGELLGKKGAKLYFLGRGDVKRLNEDYVTCLGLVAYERSWDYLYFADTGIVLAAGDFMHNNESSKIYHYIRAGLPVVCESGFPNENVVKEARLGYVVENGNLELMARKIVTAIEKNWNRENAIKYIIENHSWDTRVAVYQKTIKESFG